MAIGLDLGDRHSYLAAVDRSDEVLASERIKTTREGIDGFFSVVPKETRVVLEAGTHSPWVSALLEDLGLEVIVANPLQAGRAILANGGKNDKLDAVLLASFGLNTPRLLRPIKHRGREAQEDLSLLRARDGVVRMRTSAVNMIRGLVKSNGYRLPSCEAESFHRKIVGHIPEGLKPALAPAVELVQKLTETIRAYDKKIDELCEKYPETKDLRAIHGVGPLVALTYVLTLEDPKRFKRSRSVGAFAGLVSRQHESGESSPELRITKAGNAYLRRMLVIAAQYLLGRNGEDCDLKRFGLRLASRGGKRAKKQAVVAVARKLAVLMHRLWSGGEVYDPFYLSNKKKRMSA
jgi:transposase